MFHRSEKLITRKVREKQYSSGTTAEAGGNQGVGVERGGRGL